MAHQHVDEIVAAIRLQTAELEARGVSESEIISVAYAYFGVMLGKKIDRRHAVNLAHWTLKELERMGDDTDKAVVDLRAMAAVMKRVGEGVGAGVGSVTRRVGAMLKKKPEKSAEGAKDAVADVAVDAAADD